MHQSRFSLVRPTLIAVATAGALTVAGPGFAQSSPAPGGAAPAPAAHAPAEPAQAEPAQAAEVTDSQIQSFVQACQRVGEIKAKWNAKVDGTES